MRGIEGLSERAGDLVGRAGPGVGPESSPELSDQGIAEGCNREGGDGLRADTFLPGATS
jgi:hypothetical protein